MLAVTGSLCLLPHRRSCSLLTKPCCLNLLCSSETLYMNICSSPSARKAGAFLVIFANRFKPSFFSATPFYQFVPAFSTLMLDINPVQQLLGLEQHLTQTVPNLEIYPWCILPWGNPNLFPSNGDVGHSTLPKNTLRMQRNTEPWYTWVWTKSKAELILHWNQRADCRGRLGMAKTPGLNTYFSG